MSDALDAEEREQLCDLLEELGSHAPTLLKPWTTQDLAAHLVLREHEYVAAPGLILPGPWGRLAERRRLALARTDFAELVATIRAGPPRGFFRLRWVRRLANLNEFFVHHEDVRRANGLSPRTSTPALDEALWRNVCWRPWFLARRLRGPGLELRWSGTGRSVRVRRGEPVVCIAGVPGELLLYLFGRPSVAHVEIAGPDAAVAVVKATHFGM